MAGGIRTLQSCSCLLPEAVAMTCHMAEGSKIGNGVRETSLGYLREAGAPDVTMVSSEVKEGTGEPALE